MLQNGAGLVTRPNDGKKGGGGLVTRVSQSNVSRLQFFNVFIIRQAHLPPKVPNQANLCESFQKLPLEIECCANFFSTANLHKIEVCFCSKVLMYKYFEK